MGNKTTKVKEATATKIKPKSKKVKPSTSETPSEESGAKSFEVSAQAKDKSKKAKKKPKEDSTIKSTIKPSFGKTSKLVTKTPQEEKETPAPTIILPQTQNNDESVGETEVGMKESVDVTDSQELVASSITDLISRVVTEVVSCSDMSVSDKSPNVVAKKRKIAKKPKNISSTKSKSSLVEPPVKK